MTPHNAADYGRAADYSPCQDCGHPIMDHSGEYYGWDKRLDTYVAERRPGTGCRVEGCDCRRWFEVVTTAAKALYEHVNSDWASQVATPTWEDSEDQEQYREFVRVVLDALEGERG